MGGLAILSDTKKSIKARVLTKSSCITYYTYLDIGVGFSDYFESCDEVCGVIHSHEHFPKVFKESTNDAALEQDVKVKV